MPSASHSLPVHGHEDRWGWQLSGVLRFIKREVLNYSFQVGELGTTIRHNVPLLRHPATSLPEEAEEERPAIIDPFQADLHGVPARRISLGHAPAEVNVDEAEFSLLTPLPQLGEDPLDEVIPLGVHIIERAADEDSDGLPGVSGGRGHGHIREMGGRR